MRVFWNDSAEMDIINYYFQLLFRNKFQLNRIIQVEAKYDVDGGIRYLVELVSQYKEPYDWEIHEISTIISTVKLWNKHWADQSQARLIQSQIERIEI